MAFRTRSLFRRVALQLTISCADIIRPNFLPPIRLTLGLWYLCDEHPCTHLFRSRASSLPQQPVPISVHTLRTLPCSHPPHKPKTTKGLATSQQFRPPSNRSPQKSTKNAHHPSPSALPHIRLLSAASKPSSKLPRPTRRHPLHGRDQDGYPRGQRSKSGNCYGKVLCARPWY
jgi:hypothetical protein